MRKSTLLFLVASAAVILCIPFLYALRKPGVPAASSRPRAILSITPEEARNRLRSGEKVVLLDVRTPEEYAEKHIPGSLLLPLDGPAVFGPQAEKAIPDKNTPIFVYCRTGRRSLMAAEILVGIGYRNVYDLGGIVSWPYKTWPYETEKGEGSGLH